MVSRFLPAATQFAEQQTATLVPVGIALMLAKTGG
jgi:hypothetical protein